MREDEILAILAQTWNFNVGTIEEPIKFKEFVLDDPVLGKLDACFDPPKAHELCFKEVAMIHEDEHFLAPVQSYFLL